MAPGVNAHLSGTLRTLDPRLKILLGLSLGLSVWMSGPVGVVAHLLAFLCLALLPGLRPAMAHGPSIVLMFSGFWTLALTGVRLLEGVPLSASLSEATLLGARLGALMLLGLLLGASSSPRSLGLGWAALLRPVLRDRAWIVALALALMLDYLPLTLRTMRQLRRTVERRAARTSRFRRIALLAEAAIRSLGLTTWRRTLALAARRLDRPEAWQGLPRIPGRDLRVFVAALAVSLLLGNI